MTEENKNKGPVFKCKAGTIEAAVWEHQAEKGSFLTVSANRSYKDKETDEWKQVSASFGVNDLPKVILTLQKAYEYAMLKHKKNQDDSSE